MPPPGLFVGVGGHDECLLAPLCSCFWKEAERKNLSDGCWEVGPFVCLRAHYNLGFQCKVVPHPAYETPHTQQGPTLPTDSDTGVQEFEGRASTCSVPNKPYGNPIVRVQPLEWEQWTCNRPQVAQLFFTDG